MKNLRIGTVVIVFVAITTVASHAQDYNFVGATEVGLTFGHWQPQNLSTENIVSVFEGTSNTSPYFGFFVANHWKNSLAFKSAVGFWTQERIEKFTKVSSVVVIPLEFQLKYQLVPDTRLSPYVSYGIAAFIGTESKISTIVLRDAQLGYGFEAGAGFDFYFARRWGSALEFQYLYVQFGQPVGMTDDYSGPRISFSLYYLFGSKSTSKAREVYP